MPSLKLLCNACNKNTACIACAACFRNKSPQFTWCFLVWVRYACVHVDRADFWDMSLTLQQYENRETGRYSVFLTFPGCVYIKPTLVVSGDGKFSAALNVCRHKWIWERESFTEWPLSWNISILLLHFTATYSLCNDDTHPQPDVQSSFSFSFCLECCGVHEASVWLKWSREYATWRWSFL